MMAKIEALTDQGVWVCLAEWDAEQSEYDAAGWIEHWGVYLFGTGIAHLPNNGVANLGRFSAVRGVD